MPDKNSIKQWFEGLDTDSILERVEDGSIVNGRNIHIHAGKRGRAGAVRKWGGTKEVLWDPPMSGRNTGLGTYTDETGDTLIIFMHNTGGDHSIVWVHPGEAQARTIRIPAINLTRGFPVVGCSLVDNELLVFTDGKDYPKMINLPRADSFEKKSVVRLYLPRSPMVIDSRSVTVQLTLGGAAQSIAFSLAPATSQQVWDFRPMFGHFASEFNANAILFAQFTAHSCADYIEFTANNTGLWSVAATYIDTIGGISTQYPAVTEYWNRYNAGFTTEQVCLSRLAPTRSAPTAVLAFDDRRRSSQIEGRVFQFQYAFRFKDKERSLTSPTSDIALPATSQCQNGGGQYNCVDVSFDDPWLSEPAMRGEIDVVDLFVRNRNDGPWFRFAMLTKPEWMYSRTYRFYNDGTYEASDNGYNQAGNTNVPPVANAIEMFTDAHDNQRLVAGGITEGDPTPCMEVVLSPRMDGTVGAAGGTANVTGKIYIVAGFASPANQEYNENQPIVVYEEAIGPVFGGMGNSGHTNNPEAWNQKIPMGGWTAYLADTDLLAISTQVVPTVFVSGSGGSGTVSPTIWNAPSGSPAANRGVYDGTKTGADNNPANRTHRAAIRDCMELNTVHSTFTIAGLVPGQTYILRLASHKCFTGPGTDIYDLNSTNRAWQRTSTRVGQCGSVNNATVTSGRREAIIRVPANGAGTTIDIGDIYVVDFTNPQALVGSCGWEGYLFDDEGDNYSSTNDIRNTGVSAEKQLMVFENYVAGVPTAGPFSSVSTPSAQLNGDMLFGRAYSDHNGFFFAWRRDVPGVSPRAAWVTVGGNPGLAGAVTGFSAISVNVTNFTVLNNINEAKWQGDLSLTPLTVTYTGNLPASSGSTELIVPNLVDVAEHRRTAITARFVTTTGVPIADVSAVLGNGRARRSGTDGTISLIAYGDVITNQDDRTVDDLVIRGGGACNIVFTGGSTVDIQITQFQAGNPWSDTVPYEIGDISGTIVGVGRGRGFKRGGSYSIGCYLGRWNGDRTPVQPLGEVRFPALTEDLNGWQPLAFPPGTFSPGIGVIDWAMPQEVPEAWIGVWDFFQLVTTWDNSSQFMVQWLASQVVYSSIWDEATGDPKETAYGTGNATEIYIALTDSFVRYGELHTDATQVFGTTIDDNTGYLWEQGDMLRILTDSTRTPLYGNYVEVRITGQRGRYITIQATGAVPRLRGGEVIEIFRPRKPVNDSRFTYYDIPDGRAYVIDPRGPSPSWSATSGTLDKGDTWIIPRQVPVRPSDTLVPTNPWTVVGTTFESKWLSDFYPSTDWGKGKPWFQDPDAATQVRGALMRYSNSYKPGTNINGLNLFGGLDLRLVENWLGPIRRMTRIMDVIFVNCENGAFSIYVGVEQLQTTPDSLTETAGGILGNVRPFAHKFGCRDPLSVIRAATQLWYYDRTNAAFVQWASNQLQDMGVQKSCHSYFMRKTETLAADTVVCGGWDMVNGEALLCFNQHFYDDGTNSVEVPAECMTYHDGGNRFISPVDMGADCFGWTRQRFWSVKGGRVWLHDADSEPLNRIHGIDVQSRVFIPFIGDETELKVPLYLWLARGVSNSLEWEVASVTTSDGNQLSLIPAGDFKTVRGAVSKAAFLRDKNTPATALTLQPLSNGDQLEATAFVVELVHVGVDAQGNQAECLLINAALFYDPVPET